ncbi:MAG: glycosyl hydrolase [Cyanobacteria bacterium CRU_2_1]|nr:glycosyl hydrolase [Cyanobacteria bacterium CRU_2_1]
MVAVILGIGLAGCIKESQPIAPPLSGGGSSMDAPTSAPMLSNAELLQESWQAYRSRFIQADGRVIDREAEDRSISEAQAYAMLRAVFADDPEAFALTLAWGENNLQRKGADGRRSDRLWAWTWGKNAQGRWGVIDANFASDGDLDAITALILASRRWNRPDYLELAKRKLQDLWTLSTVTAASPSGEVRYFLPGPKAAFQPRSTLIYLNPSYLAPYAFRLFAQVDPNHDWLSLVDSSYQILDRSASLSSQGLPSNWVALDLTTGRFAPLPASKPLRTIYGFDAYRVWWRVALDAAWFDEPRAEAYLQEHLPPLVDLWRSQQAIPAQLDLQGAPLVNYESTAHYAMLYSALQLTDPATAEQIRLQKIIPTYQNGFWDNDSAYYTQNLCWFGLFPPNQVNNWLQP